MSTDEAVKVAVRVRPFNKREIARYAQILFPLKSLSANTLLCIIIILLRILRYLFSFLRFISSSQECQDDCGDVRSKHKNQQSRGNKSFHLPKQKQTCRYLLFETINCVKLQIMMIFSSTRQDSNESKTFAFDYSYWSFDGSKDRGDGYQMPDKGHSNGSKFCDQEKVG